MTLYSANEKEDTVIEIFEEKLFRQNIDFPLCGNNFLETVFDQNCCLSDKLDKSFQPTYNLIDHEAVCLHSERPFNETKPLV